MKELLKKLNKQDSSTPTNIKLTPKICRLDFDILPGVNKFYDEESE